RRHTRFSRDWSSDVCSSDLAKANVFAHAQVREQGVVLKHHGNAALGRRQVRDIFATNPHAAGGGAFQPRNDAQRGGFTAARGAKIGRASCRERGEVAVGGVG